MMDQLPFEYGFNSQARHSTSGDVMNIATRSFVGTESAAPDVTAWDADNCEALIEGTYDRLRVMASRMLDDYPLVGRWEETDDVWQEAALRLHRALGTAQPESLRHYLRLAALQIRRTLIELARKFSGPNGLAANHDTVGGHVELIPRRRGCGNASEETHDPVRLADWAEFHSQIDSLPDREREIFDLLWYSGLTQSEAAAELKIDVRSVKRRWRAARLELQRRRRGLPPGR